MTTSFWEQWKNLSGEILRNPQKGVVESFASKTNSVWVRITIQLQDNSLIPALVRIKKNRKVAFVRYPDDSTKGWEKHVEGAAAFVGKEKRLTTKKTTPPPPPPKPPLVLTATVTRTGQPHPLARREPVTLIGIPVRQSWIPFEPPQFSQPSYPSHSSAPVAKKWTVGPMFVAITMFLIFVIGGGVLGGGWALTHPKIPHNKGVQEKTKTKELVTPTTMEPPDPPPPSPTLAETQEDQRSTIVGDEKVPKNTEKSANTETTWEVRRNTEYAEKVNQENSSHTATNAAMQEALARNQQ
jgi:ribosomal protein L39E